MIIEKHLVERFFRYVRIDSQSRDERAMCMYLMRELEEMGFHPLMDQAGEAFQSNGGNLYCKIPGTLPGEPLLLAAHVDTVGPGRGICPVLQDGYAVSAGNTVLGGDDKAGVAVIMEAIEQITKGKIPHRPVELVFTVGEEIGMKGSALLDYAAICAKEAIVMDSRGTVGDIKLYAPGKRKLHITVRGRAAHAGACPEQGISAISVASAAIAGMKLLRIDGETTANIGSFLAEGATNVVNDLVRIEAEARSQSAEKLDAQCRHMIQCFETAAAESGAGVACVVEDGARPYRIREDHPLVQELLALCRAEGIEAAATGDGGGSDANNFAAHGIAAIALGCGMDRVHTTEETLCIRDFVAAAGILIKLLASDRANLGAV